MRLHTLAFGFSVLLLSTTASAGVTTYTVHLEGSSGLPGFEDAGFPGFPGVDAGTPSSGSGTFSYDDATKKLTGSVTHTMASATSAKLTKPGIVPINPDTIAEFKNTTSPIAVDATLKEAEETELLKGNVHFVVSSNAFTKIEGALIPGTGADPDAGPAPDSDAGPTDPGTPDSGGGQSTPTPPTDTPPDDTDDSPDDTDDTDTSNDAAPADESGCSLTRASSTSGSVAAGASIAGLVGLAFFARRKRRG